MIAAFDGVTERLLVEVVRSTTKFAICCWPVATSVARICACCVIALATDWIWISATPALSVTTVSVAEFGCAGLLVRIEIGP